MGADEKRMSIGSGLFTIVVGFGMLGYFGWIWFQQSSALSWPTTNAKVVTSQVEVETDITLANIVFEYSVDAQTHRSSELWFDSEPAGTPADMRQLVAGYPRGKSILVYYNPQNPSQAVEDPKKNATFAKVCVGLGFGALLVGAFMLWGGLAAKPLEHAQDEDWDFDPMNERKSTARRQAATTTLTWVPESTSKAEVSPPAKPKGPRHWAVRAIAGIIGLPVLLLFGGATIMILQQGLGPKAAHPLPVTIISTAICGGIALFGLWLTAVCFIRRGKHASCAAT